MKNYFLIFIPAFFLSYCLPAAAQEGSFAISPQTIIFSPQNTVSSPKEYSEYNFVHLSEESMQTGMMCYYADRPKVRTGEIMIIGGALTAAAGLVGMASLGGEDLNSPRQMSTSDKRMFDVFGGVVLAGCALMVTGVVVAAANGDLASHSEGFGYRERPAIFIIGGHHEHHHFHGHSEHRGSHRGSHNPRSSSRSYHPRR